MFTLSVSGMFIILQHKCEQYWPEQDNPKKPEQENPKFYGDIQVTMVELEQFADFKIRTFILNRVCNISHMAL